MERSEIRGDSVQCQTLSWITLRSIQATDCEINQFSVRTYPRSLPCSYHSGSLAHFRASSRDVSMAERGAASCARGLVTPLPGASGVLNPGWRNAAVERQEASASIARRARAFARRAAGRSQGWQRALRKRPSVSRRSIPLGGTEKGTGAPISGLPEIGYPHLPDRLMPIWLRRHKNTGSGALANRVTALEHDPEKACPRT